AQGLRPLRQGGVEQVMRTRPDIDEDQAPEMDDRKPVGIDRPFRALGNEVIHDAEEAGGQEESDRVMPVPPLYQRVLNTGEQRVAFRLERRYRHRQIVDDVQNRDGDDEGKIEPVRDVDMRLFALP